MFSQTGQARRGDTSERVRSGRIDRARTDYSHVAIPEAVLRAAWEAYWECRERMIEGAADSVVL